MFIYKYCHGGDDDDDVYADSLKESLKYVNIDQSFYEKKAADRTTLLIKLKEACHAKMRMPYLSLV